MMRVRLNSLTRRTFVPKLEHRAAVFASGYLQLTNFLQLCAMRSCTTTPPTLGAPLMPPTATPAAGQGAGGAAGTGSGLRKVVPCGLTQEELDKLLKDARAQLPGVLHEDYFYKASDPTLNPDTKVLVKKFDTDPTDMSHRCSTCGCTIAEHASATATAVKPEQVDVFLGLTDAQLALLPSKLAMLAQSGRTSLRAVLGHSLIRWQADVKDYGRSLEQVVGKQQIQKEDLSLGFIVASSGQGKTHICRESMAEPLPGHLCLHITLNQGTNFPDLPEDKTGDVGHIITGRILRLISEAFSLDTFANMPDALFKRYLELASIDYFLPELMKRSGCTTLELFIDEADKVTAQLSDEPALAGWQRRTLLLNHVSALQQRLLQINVRALFFVTGLEATPTFEVVVTRTQRRLFPVIPQHCTDEELREVARRIFYHHFGSILRRAGHESSQANGKKNVHEGFAERGSELAAVQWENFSMMRKLWFAAIGAVGRNFRTLEYTMKYLTCVTHALASNCDFMGKVRNQLSGVTELELAQYLWRGSPPSANDLPPVSALLNLPYPPHTSEPIRQFVSALSGQKADNPKDFDPATLIFDLFGYVKKDRGVAPRSFPIGMTAYLKIIDDAEAFVEENKAFHAEGATQFMWKQLLDWNFIYVKRRKANELHMFVPRVNTPYLFSKASEQLDAADRNWRPAPSAPTLSQICTTLSHLVKVMFSPKRSSASFEAFWPYCDWLRQVAAIVSSTSSSADAAHDDWWLYKVLGDNPEVRILHPTGVQGRLVVSRRELEKRPVVRGIGAAASTWYVEQGEESLMAIESVGQHVSIRTADGRVSPCLIVTQMKRSANETPHATLKKLAKGFGDLQKKLHLPDPQTYPVYLLFFTLQHFADITMLKKELQDIMRGSGVDFGVILLDRDPSMQVLRPFEATFLADEVERVVDKDESKRNNRGI